MKPLISPTLSVDPTVSPAAIVFGDGFNVAVPFIDRHLDEGRGAKVALRTVSGRTVTYADLAAGVNRFGNTLRSLGVAPGDRVLMVVKDCPEFFFLFWGAIKAGIVPVPLNTMLRTDDYRGMIEHSGCAAMVWSPEFADEVVPAIAAAVPGPAVALPMEGEGRTLVPLAAAAADHLDAVPASATAPCFWLYSSGSTGRPKAAVHRHRDMVVTSQWFGREVLGIGEDDVCFSASKLFFAYGLGNSNTVPLWAGASTVLLDVKPTPENTFAVIEKFRPTLFHGVPTLYAAQLQALETTSPDLSSLRLCVSAGEPLPAEVFRRWKERTDTVILDGIGSTEALHIFIANRPHDARPGFSGIPVPGYDVRIVDDAGREVPAGESGRLQVKGWSTAACYWNDPEKTAATMLGEWLDTGDTYRRDGEGWFQYCGRSNDMMKVGGIWCSPIEIESCLVEHPAVLEAAVVGVPDAVGLDKPEAWVVLRAGVRPGDELAETLTQCCRATLAPYKFPRRIHFVDELPKTATGKIQRFRLRRMAEEEVP
ncbi:Benzoate--CoA ligase [Rhodoplanes serenus]|uniref:Benzoate--CoA ligase n=1 Tax=Rhodoplanes serenus TaxID=200615 RepID=A0A447CXB6_9BRAD|nr:benzoate-CoA ligase family protein [Rhodoplanes serenus]VCU10001.1 Benzoate--CoA ligase [Rhodoplanes serenus]